MLSDDQVRTVLRSLCDGKSYKDTARELGLSISQVRHIGAGKTYSHVEWHDPVPQYDPRGGPPRRPQSDIDKMRQMWLDGEYQEDIALDFGLHRTTVRCYIFYGVSTPSKEQRAAGPVWSGRRGQARRDPSVIAEMRRLREEEKLTYEKIGQRLGVRPESVSNYIRYGVASPKRKHLTAA